MTAKVILEATRGKEVDPCELIDAYRQKIDRQAKEIARLHAEIERLRKIAAKYELLSADGDRCAELVATAYDEWDTDIPWFRQLDCAVAECQAPKRFTAEAKEGYCIHCSRVMGEHSKGDLYCPETTGVKP